MRFARSSITAAALLLLMVPAWVQAETWSGKQFKAEAGTITAREGGVTLTPNAQGQILVSVPAKGLALTGDQRVRLKFKGAPPPRIYVIWRRTGSEELYQHGFAPQGAVPYVDMAGINGWEGQALSLELGFLVNPGQPLTLQEVHVDTPGIQELFTQGWDSWRFFRPWLPIDINFYTGTRVSREGPYPAQFFALCALFLVGAYLLVRRSRARWSEVALIVFAMWLLLDAFWQWRLWNQVNVTRERYADKSGVAKLLASEDAAVVQLVEKSRALIDRTGARVFIASQSDSNSMRAAYYMSPLNTFWHRRGAELPQRQYLHKGDYILILGPSAIRYNRDAGHILLPDGEQLGVTELYGTRQGIFLEVSQ